MQTIWDLTRRNAGIAIAFGLTLLATDAAKAQSVPLNYNVSVLVPTTSLGVEPDLAFKQYSKFAWPFTIMNAAGAVECAGVLAGTCGEVFVKPIPFLLSYPYQLGHWCDKPVSTKHRRTHH